MALLAGARRAMLEFLGFFNWRMAACYYWDRELKSGTVNLLNGYKLDSYAKRGLLTHLARDWKEINIPFLLGNDVPVLYPWTAKEEVDLRFACLAPSIFRGGPLPDHLVRDTDFNTIFQYSYYLEELNESYHPAGTPPVIPKDMPAFLKDFRTWTIRSIPTKKEKASCRKLYHYGISGGKVIFWRYRPLASSLEDRMRERSRGGRSEDDFLSDDDEEEAEMETLSQVREQYKGVCAPRPGEKFDTEDGRQSPSSQVWRTAREAVERVARLLRENVSDSMDVDGPEASTSLVIPSAPTSVEGSNSSFPSSFTPPPSTKYGSESSRFTLSSGSSQLTTTASKAAGYAPAPSLLDRIALPGNYPRVSVTHKKGKLVDRLDKLVAPESEPAHSHDAPKPTLEQRLGMDREPSRSSSQQRPRGRSSSPRRARSGATLAEDDSRRGETRLDTRIRSPVRRPRAYTPVSTEEGNRIDKWTDEASHLLTTFHFVQMQEEHRWNPEFLDHAVLIMEDRIARVRLRLLACYTGTKTAAELLDLALMRCLPFRLAIPIAAVPRFRERKLAPTERALAESYYPRRKWNGEGFAEHYGARFLDMLRRPHVRRVASMGSSLAWLAWKNGGTVIQDFMNGPSIQVTQYGRGWSDGREENPLFITSDELSANDLDVLLGHVWEGQTERWVWPPEHILWEYCDFYSGEMTLDLDRCLL
ncbi:hypothetical protein R3P38DRAFT_3221896 [Favolaschia claudopus]|uniref:Uncharacterized protein n=1 Tax=Favolaschia claudopus TaxID=2862362 RepID=A0AAW0A0B0_9AGAR